MNLQNLCADEADEEEEEQAADAGHQTDDDDDGPDDVIQTYTGAQADPQADPQGYMLRQELRLERRLETEALIIMQGLRCPHVSKLVQFALFNHVQEAA